MFNRGAKLYSIIFNKCPRCHIGNFWSSNNPFKNIFISERFSNNSCNNCSLKYEIEPGFWYGAMYVSYVLGVVIMLFCWGLISYLWPFLLIHIEILIIVIVILSLAPLNYHLSRLIWINLFIKYISSAK